MLENWFCLQTTEVSIQGATGSGDNPQDQGQTEKEGKPNGMPQVLWGTRWIDQHFQEQNTTKLGRKDKTSKPMKSWERQLYPSFCLT
jgi:hypothetical protein